MKNLSWPVRIIISFLFLLSAAAKVFPQIWPFEKQLVDLGICGWCQAPYIARGIIGLELAIGIAILFPYAIKKVIIPITIALLVAFCIHLCIQMYQYGPMNGNCGCFGQLIPMTPLEAFIKNLLTIGLLIYLYRKINEAPENKWKLIYPLAILLASELILFAGFPFAPCKTNKSKTSAASGIIDSNSNLNIIDTTGLLSNSIDSASQLVGDSLISNPTAIAATTTLSAISKGSTNAIANNSAIVKTPAANATTAKGTVAKTIVAPTTATTINAKPAPAKAVSRFAPYANFNGKTIAVDDGKKIICMFAPGCDHCQATAKEICGLRNAGFPEASIIFMDEETEKIPDFFKEAGCAFPYQVVDIPTFWTLLGNGTTPGVICLHNCKNTKMWEGREKNTFESQQ